jgi:hypothetical protein
MVGRIGRIKYGTFILAPTFFSWLQRDLADLPLKLRLWLSMLVGLPGGSE